MLMGLSDDTLPGNPAPVCYWLKVLRMYWGDRGSDKGAEADIRIPV